MCVTKKIAISHYSRVCAQFPPAPTKAAVLCVRDDRGGRAGYAFLSNAIHNPPTPYLARLQVCRRNFTSCLLFLPPNDGEKPPSNFSFLSSIRITSSVIQPPIDPPPTTTPTQRICCFISLRFIARAKSAFQKKSLKYTSYEKTIARPFLFLFNLGKWERKVGGGYLFTCGEADRSRHGKCCSSSSCCCCCWGGDHFSVSHVQFFGV